MAEVDPDDDDIMRYVVRYYGCDPGRRERRHRIIAAFDNEAEFGRLLDERIVELSQRRCTVEQVDPQEHYSGVVWEPGYQRRQRDGRLLKRAIQHGITVTDELLSQLDLPPNVGVLRASR